MSRTNTKIIIRHKNGEMVSEYDLAEGEYLIGRDQSSDIFIGDEYVSRQHAKLTISEDAVEIEDMESTSGTFLEAMTVNDSIPILPGQKVHISDFYLDISHEERVELSQSIPREERRFTLVGKLGQSGIVMVILSILIILLWLCFWPSTTPAPRTKDEIFREKATLPTLYLTEKTGKNITLPDGQEHFVDKDTGEICWRALECKNPNCPAKVSNGRQYLFVSPDPTVFLKPDGTLGYDRERAKKATQSGKAGGCPECLKIRNLKSETLITRERYASYLQFYILPETAKRIKELDEEYKRRVEWEKKKK